MHGDRTPDLDFQVKLQHSTERVTRTPRPIQPESLGGTWNAAPALDAARPAVQPLALSEASGLPKRVRVSTLRQQRAPRKEKYSPQSKRCERRAHRIGCGGGVESNHPISVSKAPKSRTQHCGRNRGRHPFRENFPRADPSAKSPKAPTTADDLNCSRAAGV